MMEVKKQSNKSYLITIGEENYNLSLSRTSKKLVFSAKSETIKYKSAYTRGGFIDLDERFVGFTIEQIYQDIHSLIEQKKIGLENSENGELVFSYALGSDPVLIPIQVMTKEKELTATKEKDKSNNGLEEENIWLTSKVRELEQKIKSLENQKSFSKEKEIIDYNKIMSSIQKLPEKQIQKLKQSLSIGESLNTPKKGDDEQQAKNLKQRIQFFESKEKENENKSSDKADTKSHKKTQKNVLENETNSFLNRIELKVTKNDHASDITSLCITSDNKLLSCSGDHTIKIYDIKSFECENTIQAHEKSILYISLLDDGNLVSASVDQTIRVWEPENGTYKLMQTLRGHTNSVCKAIQLSNNRIGSCSCDKTIKIWNATDEYKCVQTLEGHSCTVASLIELKNNKYLVSGGTGSDKTIRFWNNSTYECEKVVEHGCCMNSNSLLEISRDRIIVGDGGKVSIINISNFELEQRINLGEEGEIWSLIEFNDNSVICGTDKGNLIDLNVDEGKIASVKEKAHNDYITCLLLLDDNTLISCSEDKLIKIWK